PPSPPHHPLSLHAALPISSLPPPQRPQHLRPAHTPLHEQGRGEEQQVRRLVHGLVGALRVGDLPGLLVEFPPDHALVGHELRGEDRKSTRLNSSHRTISYA